MDASADPEEIRMVSVSSTVRTSKHYEEHSRDGRLRRAMTSDIEVGDLGLWLPRLQMIGGIQ